jgi:hypothetical protein
MPDKRWKHRDKKWYAGGIIHPAYKCYFITKRKKWEEIYQYASAPKCIDAVVKHNNKLKLTKLLMG